MGERKCLDLRGRRFGRLTALERLDEKSGSSYYWRCVCDCGNERRVRASALTGGNTTSCGCQRRESLRERAKDIAGERFGALLAERPTQERRGGSVIWECRCDCGRAVRYSYNELVYCGVRSCGCRRSEKDPPPLHYIEGTCVEQLLREKPRRDNTSGCTGVVAAGGKWRAQIVFKGKSYYLGLYADKELAIKARRKAEGALHGEFLDWYYANYPAKRTQTPAQAV